MKIIHFIWENLLFLTTLFLIAFIPLYPKIPLLDIKNTWVYVRVEDFLVLSVLLLFSILLFFRKVTLKTPLTLPIFLFWIIGGISTLHGVLIIFPTLANVFSNVALLSFLRRIEYLSLFFVAFASIRDKKYINYVVFILVAVVILVVAYGVGQKFFSFPAYLTMNEEFAKGTPIQLSQLSRVPSTFAGHYDLAAYLVLMIPIIISLAFGVKKVLFKAILLISASLGFILLFMTVSRVSFIVLILSLLMLLILQKKKMIIVSLLALSFVFLPFFPSLLERFGSTVSEVDVLVVAKTGEALGQVKQVPASYFKGKTIFKKQIDTEDAKKASESATLPFSLIPEKASLLLESNASTGENLPQGTGYINLALSPVKKRIPQYFFEKTEEKQGKELLAVDVFYGDFLIKEALAYDLSFTTRFQGEWPKTIEAFKRNILLGNGYGSVSLAVDNNYLRILGEGGILGLASFLSIFLTAFIYIKKIFSSIDSKFVKSFTLGFSAGTFGLFLNAILIDVFEASKIAFTYWLLMGVTLGSLNLYQKEEINLFSEFKKAVTSSFAVILYLFIASLALFFPLYNYYFVGDDFTWFRWVSDNGLNGGIINFFTNADGFFYRPGAKLYFSLMYNAFWLNQTMYHLVSILLNFAVAVTVLLVSKRIFKNYLLAFASAILFIILSGHHEAIFWISATGFLFTSMFALLGLLFFIYWQEKKNKIYFAISLLSVIFSLLFHELGVITPLLIILYDNIFGERVIANKFSEKMYYLFFLLPILPYLALRFAAGSHWFSGDYSYNLIKLPFNIIGNAVGYFSLALLGPTSLPLYQAIRSFSREHIFLSIFIFLGVGFAVYLAMRGIFRAVKGDERKIVVFSILFVIISLLPFLGLGNITSRYSYSSSVGFAILFVVFFKKIYAYLVDINGRHIGILAFTLISIVFLAVHLFQLQKIHSDWKEAGDKSKKFLVSLNEKYTEILEPVKFYFVNVPIRHGEAWVFPVGLPDAIWFTFRNDYISIYQFKTLDLAFRAMSGSLNETVFEFDENGAVLEKERPVNFR